MKPGNQTILWGVVLELGLGLLAVALAWWLGFDLIAELQGFHLSHDLVRGLLATVPMLLGLWLIERSNWWVMRQFRQLVHETLVPLFHGSRPIGWAFVALAAGVGEELLFRGLIQQGLVVWWADSPMPSNEQPAADILTYWSGAVAAWFVASLCFGLAHCLTKTYALLAFLVGGYLGALYWYFDSLWIPIIAHAFYDFVAIAYLVNKRQ